jgi:hypothetical protein
MEILGWMVKACGQSLSYEEYQLATTSSYAKRILGTHPRPVSRGPLFLFPN